jgi:uncharacterized protein (TIGR00255 family)
MTGYGAASAEGDVRASVTVRSLNHRFLEVAVALPRRGFALEPEVKALAQSRLRRGRVDISIRGSFLEDAVEGVAASPRVVEGLVRTLREVRDRHRLEGEVQVSDVARFPGAIELVEAPTTLSDEARRIVLDLVARALDDLEAMRRVEGQALAAELDALLSRMEEAACRIERLSDSSRAARKEALAAKVGALGEELGLDEARLYQEVVRLVDRGEVAEELQRLRSHVAQSRSLLDGAGPSGKRLDFLAQELMREANTMGSKAVSASVVQEVVALKADIERLREQVQNVE